MHHLIVHSFQNYSVMGLLWKIHISHCVYSHLELAKKTEVGITTVMSRSILLERLKQIIVL